VVLLVDQSRRELSPVLRGGAELVRVDALAQATGFRTRVSKPGALALSFGAREVTLYERKSLVSIGGDLRLLSSPVLVEGGQWLVPLDSVPRLLTPLLGRRAEWRPASRLLLVGNVPAPRVTVATYAAGDAVRVVLESSEPVPFRVRQEDRRVTVAIPRDVLDVAHQPERLTGGIVESVQFLGGRENVFAITVGPRFRQLKSAEEAGPPARLILELQAEPMAADRPPVAAPAPAAAAAPGGLRTVVIDPGHGGGEVGAQGPGGTLEKDVTLAIARKLRSALSNGLGLQAFLTRDGDKDMALDDRAAFANNYKADLFVSIHANASRSAGAHGSEVYFLSYQAADEESRRVAAAEGAYVPEAAAAPADASVAMILWDMAQAEHLEESSSLASRLQEELAVVTGSEGRGVKQAPFRVLVGAAMPAVLVEVAFISNSGEEKLLGSDAWQNKVVSALVRGVARYQQERAGGAAPVAASGSR
jgi:N-acetylmuramoyl-L-alanine amidase